MLLISQNRPRTLVSFVMIRAGSWSWFRVHGCSENSSSLINAVRSVALRSFRGISILFLLQLVALHILSDMFLEIA